MAGIRLKRDWVSFKRRLLICNAFISLFKYHCSSQQSVQMPSQQVRGGCRVQNAECHGEANCKEPAGENIGEICESVQRQLLTIALSSIPMLAAGKKQAGMHRFNCIFLCVAYLGEKHITHCTTRVLIPTHTHRDLLFANCKLLTNMGALNLGWRDVSLFENKTNEAK